MNLKQADKPIKPKRNTIFVIWVITCLLALAYGCSVFDDISYARESIEVSGKVYKKISHSSRTGNSNSYSTSYNIIYQFENPYVVGKMELESELAPAIYWIYQEGADISIYFNNRADPKSRISHILQYWLMTIVWGACLSILYLISKLLSKQSEACFQHFKKFKLMLLVVFFIPGLIASIQDFDEGRMITNEKERQYNWPRWDALERAVAVPLWWDNVPIKYFDPMSYTADDYSNYIKKNIGADKRHREFKVAYAFLLLHQDDPLQMGWDLAKGSTREFMPLYEFFLEHHMDQEWQGDCGRPCSDATQMVEMAGDLLSMKLDENQVESSKSLIQDIMKYKYERGNNRGKYYFLYSYRRYLEYTESVEKAHQVLDAMVEENLKEAQILGLKTEIRKWSKFWTGSQRTVGMFSAELNRDH